MHLHVVGEVRGAAEALAAELTLESNPRVLPLVAAHGAGEGEALAAGAACVGSLPAVGPLVLLHVHLQQNTSGSILTNEKALNPKTTRPLVCSSTVFWMCFWLLS